MEPVKIAGLTLKSEKEVVEELVEEVEEDAVVEEVGEFPPTITKVPTITEELLRITRRVEELPNSDNLIKALAKLKGALELLS